MAVKSGEISDDLARGLVAEARAREGRFYGAMLFVSLVARKPDA